VATARPRRGVKMLIDVLLSLGTGLLHTVLGFLPTVTIPDVTESLTWLGNLYGLGQVVPMDVLAVQLGLVAAIRLGLIVWFAVDLCWRRLPVIGHGSA
jgi:hypothetical protein